MRRKDREVKDFDEIISILDNCNVLTLAVISEGRPYSVPVNFGYIVDETDEGKKLSVFFHGAGEGKKVSALRDDPGISFSAHSKVSISGGDEHPSKPCNWSCFFESVIGFGRARFLEGKEEKARGLDAIMLHNGYKLPFGVRTIAYNMMTLAHTAVVQIEVDEITGKRH